MPRDAISLSMLQAAARGADAFCVGSRFGSESSALATAFGVGSAFRMASDSFKLTAAYGARDLVSSSFKPASEAIGLAYGSRTDLGVDSMLRAAMESAGLASAYRTDLGVGSMLRSMTESAGLASAYRTDLGVGSMLRSVTESAGLASAYRTDLGVGSMLRSVTESAGLVSAYRTDLGSMLRSMTESAGLASAYRSDLGVGSTLRSVTESAGLASACRAGLGCSLRAAAESTGLLSAYRTTDFGLGAGFKMAADALAYRAGDLVSRIPTERSLPPRREAPESAPSRGFCDILPARWRTRWIGACEASASSNPDRSRHVLISLRELVNPLLVCLAPDETVTRWAAGREKAFFNRDGKPTPRARLVYLAETGIAEISPDAVDSHLRFVRFLNRVHDDGLHLGAAELRSVLNECEELLGLLLRL